MSQPVQMPDGVIIHFPDGMDAATIHAEGLKYMRSQVGPAPPPSIEIQKAANAQQVKPIGGGILNLPDPTASQQRAPTSATVSPTANPSSDWVIENVLRPILPKAAAGAAATGVA